MILADALCYAEEFEPSTIIDVATLTGKLHYNCYMYTNSRVTNHTKTA